MSEWVDLSQENERIALLDDSAEPPAPIAYRIFVIVIVLGFIAGMIIALALRPAPHHYHRPPAPVLRTPHISTPWWSIG